MFPLCFSGWHSRLAAIIVGVALVWTSAVMAADTPSAGAAKINPDHPLAPALAQAYKSREALDAVKDYEALFEKREVINGRPVTTKTNLKLREEPFSVYLLFHEPNQGREVIYVEGRNNGMLLAHETGIKSIAGTVSRAINSESAMEGNRYPITMIGMRKMLDQVIAQWEAESKFGETEVEYYPNAKIGELETPAYESRHPQPRKQFKFHKTRLFIDKQTNLPVRVEQFAFPKRSGDNPPPVEEYSYTRLKPNIGLTDRDFDTKNPNYAFP